MIRLRKIRRLGALLVLLALLVNAASMGVARTQVAAGGHGTTTAEDAVLGTLVICTAHNPGDGGADSGQPDRHCPLCTLIGTATLPPPPFALALRLEVLRRVAPSALDVPTLARHIATGPHTSRAPPASV